MESEIKNCYNCQYMVVCKIYSNIHNSLNKLTIKTNSAIDDIYTIIKLTAKNCEHFKENKEI